MFRVFYSWQSDRPNRTNRGLIGDSLVAACGQFPDGGAVEPVIDRDTANVPGAPDIGDTIFSKIADADLFVADVTLVTAQRARRPSPNPNVLIELGYAMCALGAGRIVLIMNDHFGSPARLPFDIRQLRTVTYTSTPADDERAPARRILAAKLAVAVLAAAEALRNDPVYKIVYPRTLNVIGQASGLITALLTVSGVDGNADSIERHTLDAVLAKIKPSADAPLVFDIGGGRTRPGTWLEYLKHQQQRSRHFASHILVCAPFLQREHIALLAMVDQCNYMTMLDVLPSGLLQASDLGWMASPLWDYLVLVRRLSTFAETKLKRDGHTV